MLNFLLILLSSTLCLIGLYLFKKRINNKLIEKYSEDIKNGIIQKSLFGNIFNVQKDKDVDKAATILDIVDKNLQTLFKFIEVKYKDDEKVQKYVKIFNERYKTENLYERNVYDENSDTSYIINKTKIVLCIRDKDGIFHDMNTIMMVALHEVAHMLCEEYGHNNEFLKINDFLCDEAINLGIYKKVDYKKKPVLYCGRINMM